MKNWKEKVRRQEGFTLVEMLIVVAIIAILIAVSIPLVNNALERSRVATDASNERSAKAEATIYYMAGYSTDGGITATKPEEGKEYYYDAYNGKIVADKTEMKNSAYGKCADHKDGYLAVTYESVDADESVTLTWYNASGQKIEENGVPILDSSRLRDN